MTALRIEPNPKWIRGMINELPGRVKVDWNAVETWLEEDVEVIIHPRDPYRRVDVHPSSRHVAVRIDGATVADSHSPTLLLETGLPTRYYLPRSDVKMDLLTPTDTSSGARTRGSHGIGT
ncbi:MAG: hypothetical protein ACI81L_001179 [Verrucomicrobiales bacterium]|jgi:uncharacterized protein (DUF427 family)